MSRYLRSFCVFAVLATALGASAEYDVGGPPQLNNNLPDDQPWKESELVLPAYPEDANLIEFDNGPTSRNHYFIDGNSIAVSDDGVVRYTLVLRTQGGAKNVSFEGIRCDTKEVKLYALGRADQSWAKLNDPEWQRIEYNAVNPYRLVLFRNFFCAAGAIQTPDEGRSALKRGRHPSAPD